MVEAVLGTGGMGVVVAASDPELERRVALKLVRHDIGDRAYRQRLVREARAMAQLEHDNVVRIYDAGEHDGEVFIAMELIRGETVGAWLRAGPRRWRDVLARFVAAGQGLAAAHGAGMVHRDFKPDNVLVRASDGRVCVTDFGLAVPAARFDSAGFELGAEAGAEPDPASPAQLASASDGGGGEPGAGAARFAIEPTVDLRGRGRTPSPAGSAPAIAVGTERPAPHQTVTRTGAVVGTPPYMAPEQHQGSDVDARADVFSFCVALYEALYGERPFTPEPDGDRRLAWKRAIASGRVSPPPPGRRVPASLRRTLIRGLATDPAARWPDMTSLLAALVRQRGRTRRLALAAAGAVVVAIAAVIAGMSWRARPVAPPAAYLEGQRLLRKLEFRGAAAAFERAAAERPELSAVWLGLARARQSEPDVVRAKAAIARAIPLAAADDQAHRLQVEAMAAEIDENFDLAIDRYRAYFRFFPDDVDAGLALADAQTLGGQAKEALLTIAGIAKTSDDIRLPLAEAKASMMIADWPRSKAAATRAIAVGEAGGAPQIAARARLRRGLALSKLGDRDAAVVELRAAGTAIQRLGDRGLQSRQLTALTQVLMEAGDMVSAARAADDAIAIDREIAEPHNLATDLLNAASVRSELSELDRAGELYEEAFAILRKLDDRMLLANALYNYGLLLKDIGRRIEADKALRESLRMARAADDELVTMMSLAALAWNNFGLDAVKQSESEWREVATIAERRAETSVVVEAYEGLAMAFTVERDYAGALRSAEQALRLSATLNKTAQAMQRASYALHLTDVGKDAQAAELAVAAADYLRDQKSAREELTARATAALALARLGRRDEAMAQLALGRAQLALPLAIDTRSLAAILLIRAAAQLGALDQVRAIYAAAPHEHLAVPWATELAALAKQHHLTP